MIDFLKREARKEFEARTLEYAARLGVRHKRITVRDTASRWGSCSAQRSLSYSWRLILAPPFVLDYVVAHEVAHMREMNHGPRFWKLVRDLVGDPRQRAELAARSRRGAAPLRAKRLATRDPWVADWRDPPSPIEDFP